MVFRRLRAAHAAAATPMPASAMAPGSGTTTSWPDVALNSSVWPPVVAVDVHFVPLGLHVSPV